MLRQAIPGALLGRRRLPREHSISSRRTELDFETVLVLELGGVVIPSARVRVTVCEHHRPTMLDAHAHETVNVGPVTDVKRKVVHARGSSLVEMAGEICRLLYDDVCR